MENQSEEQVHNELNETTDQSQQETEENELMYIYEWVDSIQLSRPKKNIARDFCDCVLLAEIIKYYLPRLVDLHNYPSASSTQQKIYNWTTLNDKVLKKIGIKLTKADITDVISCKSLAIEHLLQRVYAALENQVGSNLKIEAGGRRRIGSNLMNNNQSNIENLKAILEKKENSIKQLHDIIDVLEMKVKSSNEMQQTLQMKVNELTEILRNKGINV